jgi:threonine synthase
MVLRCYLCGTSYPADALINLCTCGKPLRVDLDLANVPDRAFFENGRTDMWRFQPVLPFQGEALSLGEGMTPLIAASVLGGNLFIKEEGVNPTGSFKSRGMAMAVPMAKQLGAKVLGVPSAGNAGGALAFYAARYGLEAHIWMPRDTPSTNILECRQAGAHVYLVDGLIHDCAVKLGEEKARLGLFDLSTLKEPYRIEGKKTMGYEIALQLNWKLPDVIIYPTGGGTGLVGMWKAFEEMERMGWIEAKRPKMISVQSSGCATLQAAFDSGERFAELFQKAHTIASGLRVPKAIGDFIILDLVRASGGAVVSVTDSELLARSLEIARKTGINAAPEGGATLAAYWALRQSGHIHEDDHVVLFNTGSGVKYAEATQAAFGFSQ